MAAKLRVAGWYRAGAYLVGGVVFSYALSIGSIFGMLEQGRGHHYRGKPKRAHHAHRGHHHHRSAEKPAKPEKPARKSTDGPIFSASR